MKLLLCLNCGDIFNLKYQQYQECSCKQSAGFYINEIDAVYSGKKAVCLGFANNTLHEALDNKNSDFDFERNFNAWVMPPQPQHIIKVENALKYFDKSGLGVVRKFKQCVTCEGYKQAITDDCKICNQCKANPNKENK